MSQLIRHRRPSTALVALSILMLLSLAVIGLYAGLLRAGRWQTDEYQLFFNENIYGVRILPSRLIYSPRPFSEALIFLYGEAIERLHRPLVATFLASLWSCFLLAITFAARNAMEPKRGRAVSGDIRLCFDQQQRHGSILLAGCRRRVSSHAWRRHCPLLSTCRALHGTEQADLRRCPLCGRR